MCSPVIQCMLSSLKLECLEIGKLFKLEVDQVWKFVEVD